MPEKKVLMIVDDDADDRYFFHDAVSKISADFECWEAADGEQALDKLRTSKQLPDFIFLDLNMPYMDGNQCLEELKADERLKHTPVIIYTTSSYPSDEEHTRKLGAAHFIIKSGDIVNLPRTILDAMNLVLDTVLIQ